MEEAEEKGRIKALKESKDLHESAVSAAVKECARKALQTNKESLQTAAALAAQEKAAEVRVTGR